MFLLGSKIDGQIRAARPKLRIVAPLTFTISWIFVPFNISIGAYLIHADKSFRTPVVNNILTPEVWGSAFVSLGVFLALALLFNSWVYIRHSMVFGLFIKAFWAYALVVLALQEGFWNIMPNLAMWLTIASIQAACVIYFLPTGALRTSNGKSEQQ